MKGDTTRSTFRSRKHYRGVRMQQGRVQLDADWNEQNDIVNHRVETEAADVVGRCGAPMHDPGFHVVASANDLTAEEKALAENQNPPALGPGDLLISGGRYYVDGILCENEQILSYTKQPDFPDAKAVTTAGTYLAYLDVWQRHITALEDPQIREVALGGPDTATRSKTVWQVRLHQAGDINLSATCSSDLNSWNAEIAAGTGKLAAQAAADAQSKDPCIVAPGAGYRRLENQHYRVEVHDSESLGKATFKWSRDNGSIVTKWESKSSDNLTVSSIGRDKVLSFASGQWVELLDDTCELLGKPGTLVQLTKAEGNILTIKPATATGPVDIGSFPSNPKVRRWDMAALLKPANTNWIDLEDGVQVHFTNGTYKTGDYWLIPARTATADVEWPKDPATKTPVAALPHGIGHHYCRLAMLKFDGTKWTSITDCRDIFPPLTELTSFFYVGGDGQEAMPDLTQPNLLTPLAQPLEVGVANGEWPVSGATVRFTVVVGNGKLQGGVTQVKVVTGADGIASCAWSLGSSPQSQRVTAELLNDLGNPINVPIHFSANLSVADQVAYDPKQCGSLQGQKTVQKTIETLSSLASLYQVSGDDQSELPNKKLAAPLVVQASSLCGPAVKMEVQFTVLSGGGKVQPPGGPPQGDGSKAIVITDAQGLASCEWILGPTPPAPQIVQADLHPDASHPIVPPAQVQFTAQFRAILANPGFHVTGLVLPAAGGPLQNDMNVIYGLLSKGIRIDLDDEVEPASFDTKLPGSNPVCFITAEIPYPMTSADRGLYDLDSAIGFESVVMGASVAGTGKQIVWSPQRGLLTWLERLFGVLENLKLPARVLARLTLKGSFIRAKGKRDTYLDGEVLGVPAAGKNNEAIFPSGDQKSGGDLNMWFWLTPPPPPG